MWQNLLHSQYDVDLVQKIEIMLKHKLVEFKTNEKEVLKSITKVYAARRAAVMRMAEETSKAERQGKLPHKRKRKAGDDA